MKINYTRNIFVAFIATLSSAFISNYYNLKENIILFIGVFILFCIWDWVMSLFTKNYITKNRDEILHPVTETITILHLCNIEKHYGKNFNPRLVEKCDCGSTMFRVYNEDTDKGTYIQFICAKCNQKATGLEFNWKVKV